MLLVLAIGTFFTTLDARAALHVWLGGVDGYWKNTNNWQNGNGPAIFETPPVVLDFTAGATRFKITNNIGSSLFGGLAVDSMLVFGNNYTFYGQGLGTNLVMTGNPAPLFGINYQNFFCTGTNITFDASLNLILENTNTITNSAGSSLHMQAVLTGAGGWTFQGLGTMFLEGTAANTFAGGCEVDAGTVVLNRYLNGQSSGNLSVAISGPLLIGTTNLSLPALVTETNISREFGGNDTNGLFYFPSVTIAPSGTYKLAGADDEIGSLNMTGGEVSLTSYDLGGDIDYGELQLTGNLTTYPSAASSIITGHGIGANAAALFVGSGYGGLTNVINVAGNSALVMDTPFYPVTIETFSGNLVFGLSALVKTGPGILLTTGTNFYLGNTYVEQGTWVAGGNTPFGLNFNTNNAFYPFAESWVGPANNQVVVSSGAEILDISAFTNPVPVVLNGFGINAAGAFNAAVDGTRLTGGCTLASESSVVVGSGDTLTFDNLDNSNYDVPPLAGSSLFHKQGPGTLALFAGTDDYGANFNVLSGTCSVEAGTVMLSGQANYPVLNGPLTIGTNATGLLEAPEQIASNSPVTVLDGGVLEFSAGSSQTVGSLALLGGSVEFGTVILNGDLTAQNGVNAPGFFFASFSLGGTNRTVTVAPNSTLTMLGGIIDDGTSAGFTKAGPGQMTLESSSTYGGFTHVNAGILSVDDGEALGVSAGTIVAAGAEIDLGNQINVGAEPLTLAGTGADGLGAFKGTGTNSWAGNILLTGSTLINVAPSGLMELSGAISGLNDLTKTGTGTLLMDGSVANSYSGLTTMQQGTLILSKTNGPAVPGALIIGNGTDGPDSDVVSLLQSAQLTPTASMAINSSGLLIVGNESFSSDNVGALTGSGAIQILEGGLGVENDNSSTVFSGSISGNGAFDKYGSGTLTLTGSGSLSGPVYVASGQLLVNGSLASATINVYASTLLGGTGTVGPIISAGTVSPGTSGPGLLNSGNVSFNSGSLFTPILNGTAPGSYSQLNVTGSVNLTGTGLQLSQGIVGATNSHYTIINNDAFDPVTGTFTGLPEGATLAANNGAQFTISYHGGTGNDVVLTQTSLPVPPKFTGIQNLGGGSIEINGIGLSNETYSVWANTNLATTNWITIGTAVANGTNVQFVDPNTSLFKMRFYRFSWP